MTLLLIALTLALAFVNGANDVSKGIATLVGSGLADYKRAVWWGSIWTLAGGLAAALASQGLAAAFAGKGLLAQPPQGHAFLISAAGGAMLWVLFASAAGLPVSTTHAVTGALCGAGIIAAGAGGVRWIAVGEKLAVPLLASPLLSMALVLLLFPAIRRSFGRFRRYCLCVEEGQGVCIREASGVLAAVAAAGPPALVVGESQACAAEPRVISQVNVIDALHWLTAGLTGFARALNDAPKILAMGAAAAASTGFNQSQMYALVALAMGLGSLIWGLRVTDTLARRVAPISPEEGFSANLVTSALVGLASHLALPVSTTHVSSGAIIGIGLRQGGRAVQWRTVGDMLLAWLVTLPASGLFALGCYCVVSRF